MFGEGIHKLEISCWDRRTVEAEHMITIIFIRIKPFSDALCPGSHWELSLLDKII